MKERLKIVFAGGGTGGHLFPGIQLAKAMQKRWQCDILFFGTKRGLEHRKVPEMGFRIIYIPVKGFKRSFTLENVSFLVRLWRSLRISKEALKVYSPHLVVGTGGYVMGPVLKSAQRLGIPTVVQEQNSFPGATTRLLAPKAKFVFIAYEEARAHFKDTHNIVLTGNPLTYNKSTEDRSYICSEFNLKEDLRTILVIGGSQGAANINTAVWQLITQGIIGKEYQLLWQTGEREYITYQQFLQDTDYSNIRLLPFIDRMDWAYSLADLVICRAGAITLSELMAVGIPAILIPRPHSTGDHQYKNALALQDRKAAILVRDDAKLSKNLQKTVKEVLQNKAKLEEMAREINKLHMPNATEDILMHIRNMLNAQYHMDLV